MTTEPERRRRSHDSLRVMQRHAPRVTFVGVDTETVDRVRRLLQPAEVVTLPAGPTEPLCDALLEIEPDLLFITPDRDELLALIAELKVLPETHFIPIVAVGASEERRLRAYAAGVDHWVGAPLDAAEEELGARAAAAIRSAVVARAVRDSRQELRLRRDWSRFLVHDLRNLMASALASLSTLSSRSRAALLGDAEPQAVLVSAQNELWRGVRLLNDLVDVDRVQKGVLRVRRAPADLGELARGVARRFRDAEIEVLVDGSSVVAEVEGALVDRVITNLVENAVRHATPGTAVRVRVTERGGEVMVEVVNRGASIPAGRAAELFEPWVRLESEGNGASAGAGLGLAFCRLAVEVHGGAISVDEPDGGGARFTVRIPRR